LRSLTYIAANLTLFTLNLIIKALLVFSSGETSETYVELFTVWEE